MDSVPESPERSVGYLLDMPLADQAAFGQKFDLSLQAVKDKAEAIHDWHLGNPKRNKRDNWKSVLRNALREDADKLRAKHGPYTPPGYTPTAQDWDFLRMGMVEVFIGEAKVWAEEQIRNGTVIV